MDNWFQFKILVLEKLAEAFEHEDSDEIERCAWANSWTIPTFKPGDELQTELEHQILTGLWLVCRDNEKQLNEQVIRQWINIYLDFPLPQVRLWAGQHLYEYEKTQKEFFDKARLN